MELKIIELIMAWQWVDVVAVLYYHLQVVPVWRVESLLRLESLRNGGFLSILFSYNSESMRNSCFQFWECHIYTTLMAFRIGNKIYIYIYIYIYIFIYS
jgi:hypothetical protein